MSYDNDAAPTVTLSTAESRWRVQSDLDLQDDPILAERIADYIDTRIIEAHECEDIFICEDCGVCDECGRGRDE